MKRICICMAFWITFVYPIIAQQVVHIRKVDTPPRIDGSLGDPAWLKANIFDDFKTLHPKAGLSPSERTTVYLMYNREYLYVGVRCYDSEPAKIKAESTARDNPGHDDSVAFCLDSYNDELGAFFFMITPRGIQTDGTLTSSGSPNVIFSAKWSSAARLARDGWTAEMAIPFKNLPFSWQDRVVMGFKVSRFISRKAEEVDFPEILPQRTSHLAQFTKIEFSGIDRGKSFAAALAPILLEMRRQRTQLALRYDTLTYDDQLKIWGDASVFDYLAFPYHTLKPSKAVYHFVKNLQEPMVKSVFERLEYSRGRQIKNLEQFLERTLTTAFIVIKNDMIIYEGYFNGFGRDSIVTSFSMAKSFASTLVGVAIDKGLIRSVSDPIVKYLPEIQKRDKRFAKVTIKDLLMMSAGIRYNEDAPDRDNDVTYHSLDLRKAALENTTIIDPPGKYFLYNDYHPPLIGMILERVTGKSVSEFLQEKIWEPLGMEYPGSWSIDSKKGDFEKMLVGINACAIDFAKFGSLFLNNGRWDVKQIVSEHWVEEATQPEEKPSSYYQDDPWFNSDGHYYKYFWWGDKRPGGRNDFHAVGNKGQYIYISPQNKLIIVRNGIDYGVPSGVWLRLFYEFAGRF